jgi:NAD(P)-dependent dehydrogenase (short-subunit alcohol dehydrogenase family)
VLELVESFVDAVARGRYREAGWPGSAYRVSKVALNALTRILSRELAPRKIKVNAVCPGWVRTRMGGASATRDVTSGAKSILWAATLPADGPTGGFFRDGRKIAW